ncbi:hypothetical protein BS329_00280 [Amycolatopsis coloradensis]|uniref:Uncharacterized protein n=1 Tax=Amycolatopsis coloradensis TaxID=76021 RepID=A0A1R0L395_9PSEU|nr:hypothetical protein [Amycolatopsis coloradensis]OLZ57165.1 hypothetical protein BS329_00280 [Amycolatopsis coloradensis]
MTGRNASGLQYPGKADQEVRFYADLIGADGIVELLDNLKKFLVGDLRRSLELADRFASQSKLKSASELVTKTKLELRPAWQGDGFDQFDAYAAETTKALDAGQTSLGNLTTVVANLATTVINTYKNLLELLGNCASTLAQLGGKFGVVLGSAAFPPLTPLAVQDLIDGINSAFTTLWRDCNASLTQLLTDMTTLIGAGFQLQVIKETFPKIPSVGTSAVVVADPRRWRIKPEADPA